jgi:hypothetical protein
MDVRTSILPPTCIHEISNYGILADALIDPFSVVIPPLKTSIWYLLYF